MQIGAGEGSQVIGHSAAEPHRAFDATCVADRPTTAEREAMEVLDPPAAGALEKRRRQTNDLGELQQERRDQIGSPRAVSKLFRPLWSNRKRRIADSSSCATASAASTMVPAASTASRSARRRGNGSRTATWVIVSRFRPS